MYYRKEGKKILYHHKVTGSQRLFKDMCNEQKSNKTKPRCIIVKKVICRLREHRTTLKYEHLLQPTKNSDKNKEPLKYRRLLLIVWKYK